METAGTQNGAREAAEALQKRMTNPHDWTVRVWNNSRGWRYSLRNGPLCLLTMVRKDAATRYSCIMSKEKETDGSCASVWANPEFSSEDPNEAVQLQVEYARKVVDELNEVVVLAENVIHNS